MLSSQLSYEVGNIFDLCFVVEEDEIQRDGVRWTFPQVTQLGNGRTLIWTQGFLIKSSFWPQHVPSLRPGSFLASPPSHELQTDGDCVFYSHPAIPRPSAALAHEALCVCGLSGTVLHLFGLPHLSFPAPWALAPLNDFKQIRIQIPAQSLPSNMALGKLTSPRFSAFIIKMWIQLLAVVRIK